MTTRVFFVACVFGSLVFSQQLPTYQWVKEVDASGTDSLAGLGTDAQGNIYIAGTTLSRSYPTKAAVQGSMASAGLYRISGAAWSALGLGSASAIAVDPQNAATVYAVSARKLVKSSDGGVTFVATSLPSSMASAIALVPGNSQVLFVATLDQGVLKSADAGSTWTAVNNGIPVQTGGQVSVQNLWIDPANSAVMLARIFPSGLARSADGAANWQLTTITGSEYITFDAANPGVLYLSGSPAGFMKSTDYGQTFSSISTSMVSEVLPDQNHPGHLIGVGPCGVCLSTDGGTTWTRESGTPLSQNVDLAPDWQNGVIYAAAGPGMSVVRISGDLRTVTQVGPPATGFISGLAVANGQVYAANGGSADVFVTKLDPLGNIVYSTYFGGSGGDGAAAMAVDAAGNVFVTGSTNSIDFPVSKGAYASTGNAFVFKLNPDGSLGYSTYFSGTGPTAIATDGSGSAWLAGGTLGGLPLTPGALSTTCDCGEETAPYIGVPVYGVEASLTRFDAAGSSLIFSTYVPGSTVGSTLAPDNPAGVLAVASDGTAYVGGPAGIFHIDPTGTSLLSSMPAAVNPAAMTIAPDGSLYIAGAPGTRGAQFQPTAGAFQSIFPGPPKLPNQFPVAQAAVERIDAGLKGVIAATYFSNAYSNLVSAMAVDGAGNVYLGGSTAPAGLATRTPFAGGFAAPTGFMSELSGDLSMLLFSSYFGDTENFTVAGVGIGANGNVVIGGVTGQGSGTYGRPTNLWLNSLALTPPPALRIDAVENAASLLDGPISAGETIVIKGAGFGSDARLSIGDEAVAPVSITPTAITATVPADVATSAAAVQAQSGGASSNQVLMPIAVDSPGIFSADGTGYGQGYILNKDGTLNTAANPAAPGDLITIMATGVGPMSFTQGYAVTEFPVNVFIDGVYCAGLAARVGAVSGLPGDVFRMTVYVPDPAVIFATTNPGFKFPPLAGVVMQIDGVSSQIGIAVSIAQ